MHASKVPLLSIVSATVRAGRRALGPFSLTLNAGERVAILGPSGAGKSTLLRLAARELEPRTGTLCLDDRPFAAWSAAELSRRRAVLPQSTAIAFALPVARVVALGRITRIADPRLDEIVRAAASLACADHLLNRRVDTLSGGELARVQLARVFAQLWDVERGLLLVDEPLAALDPGLQVDLEAAIDAFTQARGHALLAVIHDLNHALRGFDRLLLVQEGRQVGDTRAGAPAVPALESLYGIRLMAWQGEDGRPVVTPRRRTAGTGDERRGGVAEHHP